MRKARYAIGFGVEHTLSNRTLEERLRLSPREADCLSQFGRGYSAQQIAARLGIRRQTVYYHLDNARRKLCAQTSTEAFWIAAQSKQIPCPCQCEEEEEE